MKIYDIPGARKRRSKLLGATDKSKNPQGRYTQAYNRCIYASKNSRQPLTRVKAKTDAQYFKRKLERYR